MPALAGFGVLLATFGVLWWVMGSSPTAAPSRSPHHAPGDGTRLLWGGFAALVFLLGAWRAAVATVPLAVVWWLWSPTLGGDGRAFLWLAGSVALLAGVWTKHLPLIARSPQMGGQLTLAITCAVLSAPLWLSWAAAVLGFLLVVPVWTLGQAVGVTLNVAMLGGPDEQMRWTIGRIGRIERDRLRDAA